MASKTFEGTTACVHGARQFVRDQLEPCTEASRAAAVLLVSELATNVVRHAGTGFDVVVSTCGSSARVEIHDGAALTAAFRDLLDHPPDAVDPRAVGGRGLLMVKATALDFGYVDKGTAGKAIWFEVPEGG